MEKKIFFEKLQIQFVQNFKNNNNHEEFAINYLKEHKNFMKQMDGTILSHWKQSQM
jgi:hypothetical protein